MVILSEILLDVVSFFDYSTLVMLRLTSKHLLCFADRYADQLAFRRTFTVSCSTSQASVDQFFLAEIRADNSRIVLHTIDLDATDSERLVSAATELQSLIGPHAVHDVYFDDITFSVKLVADQVTALRHASEIHLSHASGSVPSLQEYVEIVSLFQRPSRAWLWEIPIEALVAFLESACASKLKDWSVCAPYAEENYELKEIDVSQENIVFRSFFDVSNLEQGEGKHFSFTGWNLRWDFLRRIIEAANDLQRIITIEVSKPDWVHAERLEVEVAFAVTYWRLPLDPTSFEQKSVAIRDFPQHLQHMLCPWAKVAYFSKHSQLVVFVREDMITITNNPIHIGFEESFGDIVL